METGTKRYSMRGEIDCSYITTILTASSSTSWMVWMVRLWVVAKLQVISWYIEPGLSSVATPHHSALCPTGHNLNISIKKFQENKWLVLSNKGWYRTLWSERSSNISFSSHRTIVQRKVGGSSHLPLLMVVAGPRLPAAAVCSGQNWPVKANLLH